MNPLARLKALWNNKRHRPWILAGGGAAAAAAVYTFRAPGGPEAAAENAATEPALPNAIVDDGSLGASSGPGMYGTYVASPPIDYDPSMQEMDFSPIMDALAVQQEDLEVFVTETVGAERQQRQAALSKTKKKLSKTTKQLQQESRQNDRQAKTLRKQRQELAKLKRRLRQGPKKKAKARA